MWPLYLYSPLSLWMLLRKHSFKDKIIKNFEKWQQSIKSSTELLLSMECGVITQFASPQSLPCCQHNFILDKKSKVKRSSWILCSLTLWLRNQPFFILQKSKPEIQTDYSQTMINYCLKFIWVNLNRRPAGHVHTDLSLPSIL